MPAATARLALPYPIPDDTVDVPRDVQALADKLDPITPTFLSGTYAARPAAGAAGRIYTATDTGGVYYDNGTYWTTVGVPFVSTLPTVGVGHNDEVDWQVPGNAGNLVWRCRYNSFVADAYKWFVLGGAPVYALANAGRALTNATTYAALPTDPISLTVPSPGLYDVTQEGAIWHGQTGLTMSYLSYTVGATAANDAWSIISAMGQMQASDSSTYRHTVPAGNLVLAERGKTSGNFQTTFGMRRLIARPVRVSA